MGVDDDGSLTHRTSDAGSIEDRDPAPAPKRRRVGLACSACRIRKSRCNGVRPKCEPCGRLGFECIYELPDTSANLLVPRDIFAALEDKVKFLESAVKRQGDRITAIEAGGSSARVRTEPTVNETSQTSTAPTTVVVHPDGIQDPPTGQSMTDGMAVSFVNEEDCGFFGPSSNIAFMRHIFRAMSKKGITNQVVSPQPSSNAGVYQASMISVPPPSSSSPLQDPSEEFTSAIEANILPPHHETQRLMQSYFSNTGLLFPFIHEQTFLETYERMRQQNFRANVRRTWLGLLNMILAMAVCTSGWAEDGTEYLPEQSDVYYRRARELCKTQMLRGTTLETVQYLLLMSQYLQGTQRSVQTWTIHGMAVKAALAIGLHSKDAMSRFPPLEQEMRKRAWFGCVLLDRSLSMTFGRPGAIPEEYIKLDLPKTILLPNGIEPGYSSASTDFFNFSILLYKVLMRIIATLYGHNLGCEDTPPETWMITQIFHLEQELNDWQNSLPRSLFLRSTANLPQEPDIDDRILERFRLILSLRYFSVQMLLYRPMLTNSLNRGASQTRQSQHSANQIQANFNSACIRVAEDMIETIHAVLTTPGLGRHFLGAWWFTLYYTFNAALVLFGSLLVPAQDVTATSLQPDRFGRVRRYLEKAVQALVQLGSQNTILTRCTDYLRQLLGLIDNWASLSPLPMPDRPSSDISSRVQHGSTTMSAHSADVQSELLSGLPMLEGAQGMGFEDELELGNFFTTEFQRWFERFPTMIDGSGEQT